MSGGICCIPSGLRLGFVHMERRRSKRRSMKKITIKVDGRRCSKESCWREQPRSDASGNAALRGLGGGWIRRFLGSRPRS